MANPLGSCGNSSITPAPSVLFIDELHAILVSEGCKGFFGIDTMGTTEWTEILIGESSVVVPSTGPDGLNDRQFIPVSFSFVDGNLGFKVHGRCKKDHRHAGKPKRAIC